MKKNLFLYIITLILIPILVVSIIYKSVDKKYLKTNIINQEKKSNKVTKTTKKTEKKESIIIKINKNNEIQNIELEEYIIGVVAGEMPASFHEEALKAQAIASRTFAMYKLSKNNKEYDLETTVDDQVYITESEMKNKWGEEYEFYYKKIKKAVKETENLIMEKDNQIFKSYYFAMSNGQTADSVSVFKENTIDSVSSPWDNETLNKFIVTTEYNLEEIKTKLKLKNHIENIEIISRDKTNRVEKILVNNKEYSGIDFRKLLELRSTDFNIEIKNNVCYITTKGYGHGVGMSQYGANGMANENFTYDEILKYYYQDIEIVKI